MAKATTNLHVLTKKRKEAADSIREKSANLDYCFSKDVSRLREQERSKRLKVYGELEDQRQRITSTLVMELLQICQKDDVPRYVYGITRVLDNFQGMSTPAVSFIIT